LSRLSKLLDKILQGYSDKNIDFNELRNILFRLGFVERITGSHHIYTSDLIEEIINIQPLAGNKAKAYQVKQIRQIILDNNLLEQLKKDKDDE
jgi:predicted RNA binding protein YcfA (HicA-like mRNA interferase family)